MIRLTETVAVGIGQHRAGWPAVLESLQTVCSPDGVLFDDFCDRTFLYPGRRRPVYHEPWIGMLHHPPDIPAWYSPRQSLSDLLNVAAWNQSLPQLRLLLVPSAATAAWCRWNWPQIPVVVIRHPSPRPLLHWSPERFESNPRPRIVQVGWYLRNSLAIEQAVVPGWLTKSRLQAADRTAANGYEQCRQNYETGRPLPGNVEQLGRQDDLQYDVLLAENMVFLELIAAAANNTVVECLTRHTPICLNRHVGPEEYLGADYPLFYDDFDSLGQLLTRERIVAAHHYLRHRAGNAWWLRVEMFVEQVCRACREHVPECRVG